MKRRNDGNRIELYEPSKKRRRRRDRKMIPDDHATWAKLQDMTPQQVIETLRPRRPTFAAAPAHQRMSFLSRIRFRTWHRKAGTSTALATVRPPLAIRVTTRRAGDWLWRLVSGGAFAACLAAALLYGAAR